MTDAMGHTMDAALLATVLVGALRNARRRGVDLEEQARLANDGLADQVSDGQFVTGLLVRIDLATATAAVLCFRAISLGMQGVCGTFAFATLVGAERGAPRVS